MRRSRPGGRPERVVVLRPDNLGDAVLFSGALGHLRGLYPGARITVCAPRPTVELLRHCPHVDELVEWGPERLGPEELYGLRCSTLILPVRSPAPAHHEAVAGVEAEHKHGILGDTSNVAGEEPGAGLFTSILRLGPERGREHELSVTRDFLRHLGAEVETGDVWPELWTGAEDRSFAQAHVPRANGRATLVVAPGVTNPPGKAYPSELYARVAHDLDGSRVDAIVVGSEAERRRCRVVAEGLAGAAAVGSVRDLAGETSVLEMVELIRSAEAFLGADAAPLHIATALGKPTVGIIGGGHFGRFYPWGSPERNRVAQREMRCYWCGWDCRYRTMRCVDEIPPEAVARELRAALRLVEAP